MNGPADHARSRAPCDRPLVLLLRVLGCVDLLALVAVVVPHAWLAASHRALGLGELPDAPVVGYLARSASAVYALHGAMILFISGDVRRYWRLITFLAAAAVVHGAVLVGVDIAEGMPAWWTAVEGLGFAATGAAVLAVQRFAGADASAKRR
jgi:hypothetical protein